MVFQEKKLFDKENSKSKRKGASFHESAVTILTSGCRFTGSLFCKGSSRIGGKISGSIVSQGILIIEEEAIIECEVTADEVVILGLFKGKLEASVKVELAPSSRVEGDIHTPLLIVKEGAIFNGVTTMPQPADAEQALPIIEKIGKNKASAAS